MSLTLDQGTQPKGLTAKMGGIGSQPDTMEIGEHTISFEDFAELVLYFFTNSDLIPDDPRLRILAQIQSLREIEGYNPGGKRLAPILR